MASGEFPVAKNAKKGRERLNAPKAQATEVNWDETANSRERAAIPQT